MEMFAQRWHNLFMNSRKKGFWGQVVLIVALLVRRVLVRIADPMISYRVGRFTIQLPLSHELPVYRELYEYYALNIARITQGVICKYPHLSFIDIGANVGDTIFLVRNSVSCPVLGIEGNPRFFSIMKKNCKQLDGIVLREFFVGEKDEEAACQLHQAKGSASLLNKKGERPVQLMRLETILEKEQGFSGAKILKIDTDGFEFKIIRGAQGWITRIKPVIFFEYDPVCLRQKNEDAVSIFSALSAMGYQSMLVYHNTGEYMLSVNLKDDRLIKDLYEYFSGRRSVVYGDMCAFHQEDSDLFGQIRDSEISYFRQQRTGS